MTTSVDTAYDKEEDKAMIKPKGTYKSEEQLNFLNLLNHNPIL
jgi:hypothetical protein